jgi:Ca-activated chloride channel family protein
MVHCATPRITRTFSFIEEFRSFFSFPRSTPYPFIRRGAVMKSLPLLAALSFLFIAGEAPAKTMLEIDPQAADRLSISTRLSHPNLPVNASKEVYASVEIKGGISPTTGKRLPLNIALVVDRSTSMADGKLELAKEASIKLVDMLQATDRLAIVSYGTDVSTVVESLSATPGNKEIFYNAIAGIQLSGSTNLSGGWTSGAQLIGAHRSDDAISRVLLMSDGHANHGITDQASLNQLAQKQLESGIGTSTFGIGLDYNEDLMTQVAMNGAGNYYFFDTAEPAALAAMFELECKGLSATVAKKTTLTIDVAPGVELLGIEGFAHTIKGNRATVRLGDFYSNQTKDLLVRLSVTTHESSKMDVMKATLSYTDPFLDTKQAKRSLRSNVQTRVTTDTAALAALDKDVMKRAQQVQVAETMKVAMDLYAQGKQDKAAEVVREQRASNRASAQAYDFEDDVAFGRVDAELKELESTVQNAAPSSDDGKRAKKASLKRSYDIANTSSLF